MKEGSRTGQKPTLRRFNCSSQAVFTRLCSRFQVECVAGGRKFSSPIHGLLRANTTQTCLEPFGDPLVNWNGSLLLRECSEDVWTVTESARAHSYYFSKQVQKTC